MVPRNTASLNTTALGHQYQPNWHVLQGIELAFRPGELVGLVGPNGSGKSTLLRILAGQLVPTEGDVQLGEKPLRRIARAALARRIGFLPQTVRATFAFTVEEVVAQGRYPHTGALGILTERDRQVIRRSMEQTHTLAFARRPFEVLSGGERQRVLLASVLAQEAEFLLLDEPTSALDLHHQVDVFDLLAHLARSGLGIILVTHDLNLAAEYCDRLVVLHDGQMAAAGVPAEVMREEILRRVYTEHLIVDTNPVTGTPLVVLFGRRRAAAQAAAEAAAASGADESEPR